MKDLSDEIPMSWKSKDSSDRFGRAACKGVLVVQYVTEIGTDKKYFRIVSPTKIEGYGASAEDTYEKAIKLAKELDLELHDDVVYISV